MDKIFHHSSTDAAAAPAPVPEQPSVVPGASVSTPPLQAVDVDAVMTKLASSKDVVRNNFPISEQNAVLPDSFLKKQAGYVKFRDEHTDELHARH